jgi:hypothetical protein
MRRQAPDSGDVLLRLAGEPAGVASQALVELGVTFDALQGAITDARKTPLATADAPPGELLCSFCGKRQREVNKVIAGAGGIVICDECVDLCNEIIGEDLIGSVNAVERFLAASRTGDVEAAAAEFAPNVVMLNPGSDDPTVGKEAVAGALRAVEAACDEFRHTHLLTDASTGQTPLFGLVFEAKVGEATLRGVDLIELDEHDRIKSFTVAARPMTALMTLGARMSGGERP